MSIYFQSKSHSAPRNCLLLAGFLLGLVGLVSYQVLPANALYVSSKSVAGNTFATRLLGAPTGLLAVPAGHDVSLNWAAGQNGNGYAVRGVANGNSSNCSGASFALLGSTAGTTYSDAGRYLPQGTYFCYQVLTTYGNWSSQQNNPVAVAQIGFVATSIQMINGGTPGYLDPGDQFIINFNQPVNIGTGPTNADTVCVDANNDVIVLGSTTQGKSQCNSSSGYTVGIVTGGTIGGRDVQFNATYTWGNGNRTLTVTVGSMISNNKPLPTVGSASWGFTATTNPALLLSATGGFHICDSNAGGGNCLPATTAGTTLAPLRVLPSPTRTSTPKPTATRVPASPTATSIPPSPTRTAYPPSPTAVATATAVASPTAMPSPTPLRNAGSTTPLATAESTTPLATAGPTTLPPTALPATATFTPTRPAPTATAAASPKPSPSATPTRSAPTAAPPATATSAPKVVAPTSTNTPIPSATPIATLTPTPAVKAASASASPTAPSPSPTVTATQ